MKYAQLLQCNIFWEEMIFGVAIGGGEGGGDTGSGIGSLSRQKKM